MEKKPLDAYLKTNDYSGFAVRTRFRKYHLKEIVDDAGRYHKQKVEEAGKRLRKLSRLTLAEYFVFMPECIESLSNLPLFSEYDEDELSDLTMLYAFHVIGDAEDESKEYTRRDAIFEACNILMKPIVNSGFTHPLYRSLLKHNEDAANEHYPDERCILSNTERKNLTISMNELLRELYVKKPDRCATDYFNHVVIPSIVLAIPD